MLPRSPGLWQLAALWVWIGVQSVGGGGGSVLLLTERYLVDRRKWITSASLRDAWAIGQASPGMHLIGMVGIIGHQIAGKRGAVVSIVALLVPSALITTLITAGLVNVQDSEFVRGALRGVVPVTGGMLLAIAFFMVRSASRRGPRGIQDWLTVAAAALCARLTGAPAPMILLACVGVGVLLLRTGESHGDPPPTADPED